MRVASISDASPSSLSSNALGSRGHGWVALLIAAALFALVAPTLHWLQFTNGGENGVVIAALELRRGESEWLVPTLFGEARTKKPPLATWASALAVRPSTVARLDDADPARRDAAYQRLTREIRWPGLLALCGAALAVYALGVALHSSRLGLAATLIYGSSFFWLRWSRWATTDAQLSLWVAVADVCFAHLVLRKRYRLGFIVGGAALGLAMMAKGPVAVLQCVLPIALFVAWRALTPKWDEPAEIEHRGGAMVTLCVMLGALLFLAIGGWWYAWVYWHNPNVWSQWRVELTREGATEGPPDPWFSYLELLPLMFPWCVFFIVGLIDATKRLLSPRRADEHSPIVLALLLVVAPIVVMAFFKDRKERYLLPMAAPAAVMAAWGMKLAARECEAAGKVVGAVVVHWWLVVGGAAGLILAASPAFKLLRDVNGRPLLSMPSAVVAVIVLGVIALLGFLTSRRFRDDSRRPMVMMAASTALISFFSFGLVLAWASRRGADGVSDMKPLADAIHAAHPEASVYSFRPSRPQRHAPLDLTIYLNRTVHNLPDLEALAGTSGRRLLAVNQRADEPQPFPPTGWATMTALKRGREWWHVFASPETAAPIDSPAPAVPHTMPSDSHAPSSLPRYSGGG